MAHVFDTGLDLPQRTVIRRGIVSRLSALSVANGLYAKKVAGFAGELRSMDEHHLAMVVDEVKGNCPAILVSVGEAKLNPRSVNGRGDRFLADLSIDIGILTDHLRGFIYRVESDAISLADLRQDPGIDTIIEHVRELLYGYSIPGTEDTVDVLVPELERPVLHHDQVTVWVVGYTVEVLCELKRDKGITALIEELLATHHQDGSPTENDVQALSEAS